MKVGGVYALGALGTKGHGVKSTQGHGVKSTHYAFLGISQKIETGGDSRPTLLPVRQYQRRKMRTTATSLGAGRLEGRVWETRNA